LLPASDSAAAMLTDVCLKNALKNGQMLMNDFRNSKHVIVDKPEAFYQQRKSFLTQYSPDV